MCIVAVFFLCPQPILAQRTARVSVESKSVSGGKKTVINKDIFCRADGSTTALISSFQGDSIYVMMNRGGITRLYYPASNETLSDTKGIFSLEDELLRIFLGGGAEDMALSSYGFVLKESKKDGDLLIRSYVPTKSGAKCARAEIVSRNFLPIYCAYFDKKDKLITKTYLSNYQTDATTGFTFPMRVTEISYLDDKADSTVRLDLYSKLAVDCVDPLGSFVIPADAIPTDLSSYKKKKK